MPEQQHRDWKMQIRWEKFPESDLIKYSRRTFLLRCPRCLANIQLAYGRSYTGNCPRCRLKYAVSYEGGEKMGDKEMSPKEVEELNRIKMIASFRQVIGHYVTEQAGLKRTLENINNEQKEVQERAQELLDGHRAITGHIRAGEGILERLQAAVDKLNAQIVEKS